MILSDDDIDGIRFYVLDELEKKAKVNWWDICKAVEETRGKQASMDAEQFLIDITNNTGQEVAQAQDAQTRQETLREVGKWLETRRVQCTSPWNYYIVDLTDSDIEALKRGEMPEQSGT